MMDEVHFKKFANLDPHYVASKLRAVLIRCGWTERELMDAGYLNRDFEWNFSAIKKFAELKKRTPNSKSKDPGEKRLGVVLTKMCANGKMHRPEVKAWRDLNYPINSAEANVKAIKEFEKFNKKIPKSNSKDAEEARLGRTLSQMCGNGEQHRPEIKAWRDLNYPINTWEDNVKAIKEFSELNNRTPSQTSKDPEEKRLGIALSSLCKSGDSHRPEVKAWRDLKFPKITSDANIKALKEFTVANRRTPDRNSKDPEEKRLGIALSNMCGKGRMHRPEVKAWRDSLK